MPDVKMVELKLVVIECAQCYMPFGVSDDWQSRARRNHQTFYCPQGHAQSYRGESDLEREQRLRKSAEARMTSARDQLQSTEYALRAQKAAKTRIKNRIANGVCPCCNRSFVDLHRHMAGQHPDFVKAES